MQLTTTIPPDEGRNMPHGAAHEMSRRVYVIDDDADLRKSLHFALATSNINAWPFATPEDFLDQLATLEPAPVLLDFRMPTLDGIQVLETLKAREIDWPVIMMTAHGDIPTAVNAMKLGAVDFVEKPFCLDELDALLDKSFSRLTRIVAESRERRKARGKLSMLSPRETETIGWLVQGLSNKEVAQRLNLSPRTVEIHRANGLSKLGAKSVAEVVRMKLLAARQENP